MTATVVWFVVAAAFAAANWRSRLSHHRPTELWSKPLTLVALIGAALALDPNDPTAPAWFVIALVLCARRRRVPARRRLLVRARAPRGPRRTPRVHDGFRIRRASGVGGPSRWPVSDRALLALTVGSRILAGGPRTPPGIAASCRVVPRRDLSMAAVGGRRRQLVRGRRRNAVLDVRHDPRMAAVRGQHDRGCQWRSWSRTTSLRRPGDLADLNGRQIKVKRSSRRRGVRTRRGLGRCRPPTRSRCTSRPPPRMTAPRSPRPSSGSGRRSPPG